MTSPIREALIDQILLLGKSPTRAKIEETADGRFKVVSEDGRLNLGGPHPLRTEALRRAEYLNGPIYQYATARQANLMQWVDKIKQHLGNAATVTSQTVKQIVRDLGLPVESELEVEAIKQKLTEFGMKVSSLSSVGEGEQPAGVGNAQLSQSFEETAPETMGPSIQRKKLDIDTKDGVPQAVLTVVFGDPNAAKKHYDSLEFTPSNTPQNNENVNNLHAGDSSMNTSQNSEVQPVARLEQAQVALTSVQKSIKEALGAIGPLSTTSTVKVKGSIGDLRVVDKQVSGSLDTIASLISQVKTSRYSRDLRGQVEDALKEASEIAADAGGALQYVQTEVLPSLPTQDVATGETTTSPISGMSQIQAAAATVKAAAQLLTVAKELTGTAIPPTGAFDSGDKKAPKEPVAAEQNAWEEGNRRMEREKSSEDSTRGGSLQGMLESLQSDFKPARELYKSSWVVSAFGAPVFSVSYKQALGAEEHSDTAFNAFKSASYGDLLKETIAKGGVRKAAEELELEEKAEEKKEEKSEEKKEEKAEDKKEEKKEETPLFKEFKDYVKQNYAEGDEDATKIDECDTLGCVLDLITKTPDEAISAVGVFLSETGEDPSTTPEINSYPEMLSVGGNRRTASGAPEFGPSGHAGEDLSNTPTENDKAYYNSEFGDAAYARELVNANQRGRALVQKRAAQLAELQVRAGIIAPEHMGAQAEFIQGWTPSQVAAGFREAFASLNGDEEFVSGVASDTISAVQNAYQGKKPAATKVNLPAGAKGSSVVPQLRTTSSQHGTNNLFTTTEDKLLAQGIDPTTVRRTTYYGRSK